MKLVSAVVGPYKSITTPQAVAFEEDVTVFVGQNEAGKSAVLEALNKTRPVSTAEKGFDVLLDYPRKDLRKYEREHPDADTVVATLKYRLSDGERKLAETAAGIEIPDPFEFALEYRYDDESFVSFQVDEASAAAAYFSSKTLTDVAKFALHGVKSLNDALPILEGLGADADVAPLVADLKARAAKLPENWGIASYAAYIAVKSSIPQFLYFSDYNTLPGKLNLNQLKAKRDSNTLDLKDRAVLALLSAAGVELDELLKPVTHEQMLARLQSVSIEISDRVFEFWRQNEQLEVEIDVREDRVDEAPFNSGLNIYIHIKNTRHRVSVPFDQRSKGFVWFFSFIVWFDDAQAQAEAKTPIFLLLDEPGLNLHALAQADFLKYIDHLGETHQVLYTTHSPFLVESDALERVRVIEDRDSEGTTVSDQLDSRDPKSIFPLQAALGYTIAQNLFIAEKNLLVEGPADLLYLQAASSTLEAAGRTFFDSAAVLVPTGGVDKIATFIALLRGNKLKIVVCSDNAGTPDQHLTDMIKKKIISDKVVLDYAMFRSAPAKATDASDVEDLFEVPRYLKMFNDAFATELKGQTISEADLAVSTSTRIVIRINEALAAKKITLRKNGGFNHYLVASRALIAGLTFTEPELAAFEKLFKKVNALLA
jgi:energy-coupling factor transporter ATP-binding protein EcfA2